MSDLIDHDQEFILADGWRLIVDYGPECEELPGVFIFNAENKVAIHSYIGDLPPYTLEYLQDIIAQHPDVSEEIFAKMKV